MKKFGFVFIAAVALVSCQKGISIDDNKENQYFYSFTASQESESKTVINNLVSMWSGDEAIRVLGKGNKNYIFQTSVNKPVETAVFTYSGSEEVQGFGDEGNSFYAVYPSGSAELTAELTADNTNHIISGITVPTTQTAVEGSYDVMAPVAVAYCTDGKTLEFKNVTALVKFQVLVEGVKKVTFSGNNSEPLSGGVSVSYNNGEPAFTTTDNTKTYVELICDDGFKVGTDYYFSILPNTFTQGFKVEINGMMERYLETEKTVKRSSILSGIKLGTLVPSIVCSENHWTVARGAMTLEGDYYVKRGVKLDDGGFKVVTEWSADDYKSWKSTIESSIQTNCWYNVYWCPPDNATLAIEEGATYDFYVDKERKSVCVVKSGDPMPEKSLENTQLYLILQNNWNWGSRNLHYWYSGFSTTWPGISSTNSEGIKFKNDESKLSFYWRIDKNINGKDLGFKFSNNGDSSQSTDNHINPFNTDHYYYLDWTKEKGNFIVYLPLL